MARTQAKTSHQAQAPAQVHVQQRTQPQAHNTATISQRQGPTNEQIAKRAYELFLARGGAHGHHEEDWNQAERELKLNR
jgi:hypothetical protein